MVVVVEVDFLVEEVAAVVVRGLIEGVRARERTAKTDNKTSTEPTVNPLLN